MWNAMCIFDQYGLYAANWSRSEIVAPALKGSPVTERDPDLSKYLLFVFFFLLTIAGI